MANETDVNININLQQLDLEAKQIRDEAKNFERSLSNVRISIMQLTWKGQNYENFINFYNSEISNLCNIVNYILNIPEVLSKIIAIYRKVDTENGLPDCKLEKVSVKIEDVTKNKGEDVFIDTDNLQNIKDAINISYKNIQKSIENIEKK